MKTCYCNATKRLNLSSVSVACNYCLNDTKPIQMFSFRHGRIKVWASPICNRGALKISPPAAWSCCLPSAHTWKTVTTTFRYKTTHSGVRRKSCISSNSEKIDLCVFTDTAFWEQRCCGWTCHRCAGAAVNVIVLPAAPAGPEHDLQLVSRTFISVLEQFAF